jgi:hypothetical protein
VPVLRIEHPVLDYDAWKQAFDRDPAGREQAGVRRYQVFRGMEDPNYVLIDLEFDTATEAQAMFASLQQIWEGVSGTEISDPHGRIVETVETKAYRPLMSR